MAVVSISRIQVRRGKKTAGTGLPQLASGEFGWAIDSQELFIGNGSVSEGAPSVGNTQILTEHDDLFQYANAYTYKVDAAYIQTDPFSDAPITRTLQHRLDDRVSSKSFGADGDGTDQTSVLQNAIYQLYLNDATKSSASSRVILNVEAGEYVISSTINIPSYVNIVGAGIGKTVFRKSTPGPMFRTINGTSTPNAVGPEEATSTLNQPRNIRMEGLTLELESILTSGFDLFSSKESLFTDIEVRGIWEVNDNVADTGAAIVLRGQSPTVTAVHNVFERVIIKNASYAVYSDSAIKDNVWSNCYFEALGKGVSFGENTLSGTGPLNNVVEQTTFKDIQNQGFLVVKGTGNVSTINRYYSVGNNGGSSATITNPVIEFQDEKNLSQDDWFQRTGELGYAQEYINGVPYIPEVQGPTFFENAYTNVIPFGTINEIQKFVRFPAEETKNIEIEYYYRSNTYDVARKGNINVMVDPANNGLNYSDDYTIIGNPGTLENIELSMQLFDENGDSVVDTVVLMMLNSNLDDDAQFYYRFKTVG